MFDGVGLDERDALIKINRVVEKTNVLFFCTSGWRLAAVIKETETKPTVSPVRRNCFKIHKLQQEGTHDVSPVTMREKERKFFAKKKRSSVIERSLHKAEER